MSLRNRGLGERFDIDKITAVINEIYDTGNVPEELSKSIIFALPKKPDTHECGLHRSINLISQTTIQMM